jgi:uncharacterized repeat protein (TIGR02543 family)
MTPLSKTVVHGGRVIAPGALTETGYDFGGWFKEAACSNQYIFTTPVTGNLTLYAKWTATPYTITLSVNGGNTASVPASINYTIEDTVTLPIPTHTTDFFRGWNDSASNLVAAIQPGSTGNMTLTAQWTTQKQAMFNANGGSGSVVNLDNLTSETITLPNGGFTRTGWTLDKWNTTADGTGTDYTLNGGYTFGTGSVTLYAKWKLNGDGTSGSPWQIGDLEMLAKIGTIYQGTDYSGGYFRLTAPLTPTATTTLNIPSSGTVYLDGGGYSISRGFAGSDAYLIDKRGGGSLTLTNIILDGKKAAYPASSRSYLLNIQTGTVTLGSGARVKDNNSIGVAISTNGTLYMENGSSITGNDAVVDGGGVYSQGKFIMNGGDISGNTAASNGGGIYSRYSSELTINNGTISGNHARIGGGVWIGPTNSGFSKFTMNGGTISGNTATATGNYGGGVYADGGTDTGRRVEFTMNAPQSSISGNTPTQVEITGNITGITAGW